MGMILSLMWKICGHSAVTRCLQLAPYSDLARLPHMVYFRLELILNVWRFLLFRCWVPTELHIFAAWAQDIWMYCKQSTLQHWWPAGYSQEHPGVALSTSYGHICSQPQLGNDGIPGVSYGHGTGLNTKLRRTSPVCRREVSTSPWMELGCQGIGHYVLFASAICCNDISASFMLPV